MQNPISQLRETRLNAKEPPVIMSLFTEQNRADFE